MPIITNGLLGYWNSKQGFSSSQWDDLSGNGRHFELEGTPVVVADGVYFDGVDDKGELVGNLRMPITTDYTIEFGIILRDVISTSYILYGYDTTGIGHHRGINFNSIELLRVNTPESTATNYTMPINVHVNVQIKRLTDTSHALYVNNLFVTNFTTPNPFVGIRDLFHIGWDGGTTRLPATISHIRIYNRSLSTQELNTNFLVGKEVGLGTPPLVSYVSTNKETISDETTMNQSIITVRFDIAITEYIARLNGVDHNTGTVVHTGGAIAANTDAHIIVDWNELSTEGPNRINIYGKSLSGEWTPYTN